MLEAGSHKEEQMGNYDLILTSLVVFVFLSFFFFFLFLVFLLFHPFLTLMIASEEAYMLTVFIEILY